VTVRPDNRPCLILASNSPRRRQLLEEAGYAFKVIPPTITEPSDALAKAPPAQQAEALAYFKARSVFDSVRPDLPVLGADTVVAVGNTTVGKPVDARHAREILTLLAGTRHQVITALALIDPGGHRLIASEASWVRMRAMSPAEIDRYIAGGTWQGKAGAYGIQDHDDAFVECVEGSFTNVMGLPMELLKGLLAQLVLRHGL